MTIANQIKYLLDGMNNDQVSIKQGIDIMSGLLREEIKTDYIKAAYSKSGRNYWKITEETLKRILKEIEELEK